jgi:hypothetical protein
MERASDSGTNRLGDNLTILVLSGNGYMEGRGIPCGQRACFPLRWDGGPGRSRTADQRFRKPLLYPTELRGRCDASPLSQGPLTIQTRAASLAAF